MCKPTLAMEGGKTIFYSTPPTPILFTKFLGPPLRSASSTRWMPTLNPLKHDIDNESYLLGIWYLDFWYPLRLEVQFIYYCA